jgi:hypothetical protein
MKYLYELTGYSHTGEEKSWDRFKRTFKKRIVGENLWDVINKLETFEKSSPIIEPGYRDEFTAHEIKVVCVEHASLISDVHLV